MDMLVSGRVIRLCVFLHKVALHFLMMVELKSEGREDNEDT